MEVKGKNNQKWQLKGKKNANMEVQGINNSVIVIIIRYIYLMLFSTPIVNQSYPPFTRVPFRNNLIHVFFCFLFRFQVVSFQTMFIVLEMLSNMFKDTFIKAFIC